MTDKSQAYLRDFDPVRNLRELASARCLVGQWDSGVNEKSELIMSVDVIGHDSTSDNSRLHIFAFFMVPEEFLCPR